MELIYLAMLERTLICKQTHLRHQTSLTLPRPHLELRRRRRRRGRKFMLFGGRQDALSKNVAERNLPPRLDQQKLIAAGPSDG